MPKKKEEDLTAHSILDISEDDVLEAMKDIGGYLDITPGDFRKLYRHGYKRAVERIRQRFKARDIMTRDVFSVKRDTSTEEIADLMATQGITGLPVVDDEKRVIGIISETDFLSQLGSKRPRSFMDVIARCMRIKTCAALPIEKQKAEDIMTSPAVTAMEDISVTEIAAVMTERGINRVPITDAEGKLIGIVSRTDIVLSSCTFAMKETDAQ